MARKKTASTKKSRYTPLEKFAYEMGKVERGLASDTKVRDSYNRGLAGPKEKKPKKPLY